MKSIARNRALVVLILAAMVALRAAILAVDAVPLNSDEAIVALMARHILHGERPTFFYGQAYLGSTDAWLVAIGFSLLGESVLAMRVVQIALFAATLVTTYLVARRLGLGEGQSLLATLWMALPPTMLTLYTTATLGGYGETLLFGNLLIMIALSIRSGSAEVSLNHGDAESTEKSTRLSRSKITSRGGSHAAGFAGVGARSASKLDLLRLRVLRASVVNNSLWRWMLFGLLAGFAFWTFGLILVYLIPVSLWLLHRHRLRAWRGYAIALAGFAIGSAPWWTSIGALGGSLVDELAGSAVAGTVAAPTLPGSLGVRLINFLVFGVSAWWGLRYPWSPDMVLPIVGVAVAVVYLIAFVVAVRRGPRVLWGLIGTLALTYLLTPFGGDPSGRYFVAVCLPLSVFAATGLGEWWQRARSGLARWLVGLLVAWVIGYNVAGTLLAMQQPHGITTQFDRVTWIERGREQDLIDFLIEHGETRGYTNYWVAYPIAFLSREQIVSAPRLPYHLDFRYTRRDDRYPPYAQAVASAARAFYVTTNHPELDARIRERLSALGVTFREETIGSYHVFYALSRKVDVEEVTR